MLHFEVLTGRKYTTHPTEKIHLNLDCLYMTLENKKKRKLFWMEKQWGRFLFQMFPGTVKRYYAMGSKRGRDKGNYIMLIL